MAKKQQAQYIGEKEIEGINGSVVKFKDWTEWVYTERQLSYVVSDSSKDDSAFYDIVIDEIVKDVIKALQENSLDDIVGTVSKVLKAFEDNDIMNRQVDKVSEKVMLKLRMIMETVVVSYNKAYEEAVGKAFGTYKEGLHSTAFIENIRVSDIARLKN